jgi:hypothetical protein
MIFVYICQWVKIQIFCKSKKQIREKHTQTLFKSHPSLHWATQTLMSALFNGTAQVQVLVAAAQPTRVHVGSYADRVNK